MIVPDSGQPAMALTVLDDRINLQHE